MNESLDNLCWPVSKVAEAIKELSLRAGLLDSRSLAQTDARKSSTLVTDEDALLSDSNLTGRLIEVTAEWMGLEADSLSIGYAEIEEVLCLAPPLIIRLRSEGTSKFLAVARGNKRFLQIVAPDGNIHRVKIKAVSAHICRGLDAMFSDEFDHLLESAGVSGRKRDRARLSLLREAIGQAEVGDCWLIRLPPGAGFLKQLRRERIHLRLISMAALQFVQYLLLIGSWWVIGAGALQGRFEYGWLLAWALLLLTMIPLRLVIAWMQGAIAIGVGGLLKQRLLHGALKLDSDKVRQEGSGGLLGRVIESAAIEALATTGGFMVLSAAIELLMALFVLSRGAGGLWHVLLFIGWLAISALIGWRYFKQRDRWTDVRLSMTNDMVERMSGHRTRLAQELRHHWHDGEDHLLTHYIDQSKTVDRSGVILSGFIPRGWLLAALLGLIPSIISGDTSPARLAISIGGMLLGYQGLGRLTGSISQATSVAIAWKQIKDLFTSSARDETATSPAVYSEIISRRQEDGERQKVIEGADLSYRYRPGAEPVLRRCSIDIFSGERILLEGPSGEGKSTLASLLVGMRKPDSGLLLLNGLDHQTLGTRGWRAQVTVSPQFHENHVMAGTMAFNLLMGRRWPPAAADLEEARVICEELGLGELLERMPGGLSQMVGETGWQLSHGERSRLFIARALLQRSELIVLDESFAALDPENLRRSLHCAINRSRTLIVVAHP